LLAYVFWHRPAPDVERAAYEERLRAFHARLGVASAAFRLHALPWRHEDGYEDWYLVEDWTALGELNARAVKAAGDQHDRAARLAAEGWAGVWRLVDGRPEPPGAVRWQAEAPPAGTPHWRRQMTLGPAPQHCLVLGGAEQPGRVRIL